MENGKYTESELKQLLANQKAIPGGRWKEIEHPNGSYPLVDFLEVAIHMIEDCPGYSLVIHDNEVRGRVLS